MIASLTADFVMYSLVAIVLTYHGKGFPATYKNQDLTDFSGTVSYNLSTFFSTVFTRPCECRNSAEDIFIGA